MFPIWIVPLSMVTNLNCALIQLPKSEMSLIPISHNDLCLISMPQIELCLTPTPSNWIVPNSNVPQLNCALFQYHKMNCALFLFHQIEMCFIPMPRNWVVPNSNVSFWRGNINWSTVFAPQSKVCFWSTHVCIWSSSNTPTGLYIPSLAFWSPPPSIVLVGKPETIE